MAQVERIQRLMARNKMTIRRTLLISPEFIVDFCKAKDLTGVGQRFFLQVIKNGLPADVRYLGGHFDQFSGVLHLDLESDCWTEDGILSAPEFKRFYE